MSRLVFNRTGGAADEYGHLQALNRLLTGDVIEGMQVVAATSPNMTVIVSPGSARVSTGTYPTSYGYWVAIDTTSGTPAGEVVTITTAPSSNSRIDTIVAYVDLSVTASTSPANNVGMLKVAAVPGTVASSPSAPSGATIQSVIGAANPYIKLANITVGTSVTQITNGNITDTRTFAILNSPNLGSAWHAYTPTFTNLTVGNGTLVGSYTQIGKTIHARVSFILGNTSAISGEVTVSHPVTSATPAGLASVQPLGLAHFYNNGSAVFTGFVSWASTSAAFIRVSNIDAVANQVVALGPGTPFTWASTYQFAIQYTYEAL